MRETWSGLEPVVGDKDAGGRFMFYERETPNSKLDLDSNLRGKGNCYVESGRRTSSNLALPFVSIRTGWIPSSSVTSSQKRRKAWCGWTGSLVSSSITVNVIFSVSVEPTLKGSGIFGGFSLEQI